MPPTKDVPQNIFATLYLTGATVGHYNSDIYAQSSDEVMDILVGKGFDFREILVENDPSPRFRVEQALVNGGWEDCWQTNDMPTRFSSRAEAQRAIVEAIKDARAANMCDEDLSDFRIQPEPKGHSVPFLEVPLALDLHTKASALTVALADKLSAKRSPPNSASGAMNMIREMTDAHPDVDPYRIIELIDAFDNTLSPDMKGAAIVSLATIMLDGNAEKLNESLKEISREMVYPQTTKDRASSLQDFIENISDTMSHEALLDATKIIPIDFSTPTPAPQANPSPRRPGPAPSM